VTLRVFSAVPWTFHQLGVLSTGQPTAPLPPRFYDVMVPTYLEAGGRSFALLDELIEAPVDGLPAVLLVDVASDEQLQQRMVEARHLLTPMPEPARAPMLALLVSSWLGGHVWDDEADGARRRASSECHAWRRQRGSNVRPLGSVRCGDRRARALLFKVLFDQVLLPLARSAMEPSERPASSTACRLHRTRDGRYECWLHAITDEESSLVHLGGSTLRNRGPCLPPKSPPQIKTPRRSRGVLVDLCCS